MLCLKLLDEWQTAELDEMLHSVASHLGLHCLLRPVGLNTYGKYCTIYQLHTESNHICVQPVHSHILSDSHAYYDQTVCMCKLI